ncbi:MAG: response regulator transcription factor [Azospirillaceae bacterium]|nr:response regulator transcription factor [Azospirillaceae bacterium]
MDAAPVPLSLLIVEDDVDLSALLVECLTLLDFNVIAAASALELYQRLATAQVDAVVVDLGLPDLDGFTVSQFLRQHTRLGIIAVTAAASLENRLRFFECGADLFFSKPLDCRELAAAARGLIHRLRSTGATPAYAPMAMPPAPAPVKVAPLPPLLPLTPTNTGAVAEAVSSWLVDSARWRVCLPGGGEVRLAAKEMQLLVALAREAGATVPRETLRRVLGYPKTDHGERSLEAVIRRLRAKLTEERTGTAPIQTVHGAGYLFSAPVRVL